MPSEALPIRGYKAVCSIVSATYLLLGAMMLARGVRDSMGPFGVPEGVLASAHFADFFHFVFVHMVSLGVTVGMLGWFVERGRHQRLVAGALCALSVHYAYLDFRTSDSPLGNGLYRGRASLMPALIDVAVALAFAYVGTRGLRARPAASLANT